METFIVRIYRRNVSDSDDVAGIVEFVGQRRSRSFVDLQTLVDILRSGTERRKAPARKRRDVSDARPGDSLYVRLLRSMQERDRPERGGRFASVRLDPVDKK